MTARTTYPRRAAAEAKPTGYTEVARYATALATVRARLPRTDWPDADTLRIVVPATVAHRFAKLRARFPDPAAIVTEGQLREALGIVYGKSFAL